MNEEISRFIYDNQNFIYSIANYFKNYQSKEDLFQVGVVGIIKAYPKYDPTMGIKLTTYLYPYILGEMKKFAREDRNIKVSRDIRKLALQIERATLFLTQKWYRNPTIQELAYYLGESEQAIASAIGSTYSIYSTDEPINGEGKEMTLCDVIPDRQRNIDELLMLKEELASLSPTERTLIQKRYFCDQTQTDIAKEMGMSQVQVSRKEKKILVKMRDNIAA